MQETQEKTIYPGITEPLSLERPTVRDNHLTDELQKTLVQFGSFDSKERAKQREFVLKCLDKMTKNFVQTVYERQGFSKEEAIKAGGKVFTYGSYRLGANTAEADIDTLCVFPKHVARKDFFTVMLSLLRANEQIKDITSVADAYVPVIKFKYNDIPIDFVCARLNVDRVPEDMDLKDPKILWSLDEYSIRSLNGTRVADDILRLVPNVDTFRTALRCIKLWATRKAIYSNMLGFLGGVAWAILVARVCQLYPNASASTVVHQFFHILVHWSWPSPVMLKVVEDGPALAALQPWNPKVNPTDRSHRMPIITPSYPSMCATHNVTPSTQRIITGEIKQAAEILEKIMHGSTATWARLFQPHNFFEIYMQYLQITVIADSYHLQLKWAGLVEAKLRQLVIKLESIPSIALVHPFTDGFSESHPCVSNPSGKKSTANPCSSGKKIHTKTFYVGLYLRLPGKLNTEIDISEPIQEFKSMLRLWPKYDYRRMTIEIDCLSKTDLPKEVVAKLNIVGKRALKVTHCEHNAQFLVDNIFVV
ncbi:Poly(A) polymerase central domain-containing protein [Sporodiniella umbellata]|nr:Poly(A) polymerase central domain-containing protein [Sporodiniella umbellata]